MKDNKKFARIMAIVLTVALVMTFIIPAFAMLASAAATVTTEPDNSVFISNVTVNGNLEQGGAAKDVYVTVTDQRVKVTDDAVSSFVVSINPDITSFSYGTPVVDSYAADEKGLTYTVKFPGVVYNGGDKKIAFEVSYSIDGNLVAVPIQKFEHTLTQAIDTPEPTPTPTPAPVQQEIEVDAAQSVYVQSYKVVDKKTNKELTTVNPGQTVKLTFNIVDNRVTYLNNAPTIRSRMAQGSFKNNNYGDVKYEIVNVGTQNGRKILAYKLEYDNVVYQGGANDLSFDVSYTNASGAPVPVPYTELKQNITQAIDNVAEPKIILNSANYGGAAYVDKTFTLSTKATNTSAYHDLENVSVRVELPAGIAMADGNSQAIIGKVGKNGEINHDFSLVVTGVESSVTSLPVNIVYEFEAVVQGARKTFTNQQSVAINVEQETIFDISKLDYMEAITAGEEDFITVYLLNKGKTQANNVTVELVTGGEENPQVLQTVFAGNVAPGTESTQDIYFTVNETGTFNGRIVVSFENNKGKRFEMEKEISMEVMEGYNNNSWEEPMMPEMPIEEEKGGFPWIAVGVAAVIAAVVAGVIIVKKRKAKKNAEDEDEDI